MSAQVYQDYHPQPVYAPEPDFPTFEGCYPPASHAHEGQLDQSFPTFASQPHQLEHYYSPPLQPDHHHQDDLAGPAPHSAPVYYSNHPHAPEFAPIDNPAYTFDQQDNFDPAYSVYPDARPSLSSIDTCLTYDDPAQLDPARGRSDSSASTQQSSIYACSPVPIQAPLPLVGHAAGAVYATPPMGQGDGLRASNRLVDSLERQAASQGRTVPGVSFGEPPKRLAVNTRLDGVAEEEWRSPQQGQFGGPSGLSQSVPVSAGFARKRGSIEHHPGSPDLPPTPKRFCPEVVMPLTPDPTPSTYTIPGPAQPAYVYGLQSAHVTPASAVPRSMGMQKVVSRTLNYGTQQQARPAGVPRSCSYDSLSPALSPHENGQMQQGSMGMYAGQGSVVGEEVSEQDGYFQFQPVVQQRQRCNNVLASPMSLPIDRGQFQHYPHLTSSYQSEPNSPYSAQPYHHPAHSASSNQYGSAYVDLGQHHPHSPMTPGSRRGSVVSATGFTPTQSALLSAASMNRILAARAAGEDGRPTSAGVQYTLHGQPLHSPTSHPLSASHSAAPSPPIKGHIQPHAYPLARPVPLAAAPGLGPVEAIHPRYRDASPPKSAANEAGAGEADAKMHGCEQPGCGKKFKRLEHLRRHERTHTQDRPYGCDFEGCGRWFSRSDNLTQHRKTHLKAGHGGEAVDGRALPPMKKA